MKVIKKDGRLQEFDKSKLYGSLLNASNSTESNELNESDIKILVEDISKIIIDTRKDNTPTSSYEIRGVMAEVLKKDGFKSLLKSYLYY